MSKDIAVVERLLKALANRRRLMIVKLLQSKGEASVGAIAEGITLSFKSTSHHLRLLRAANILDKEQTSTTVLYRLQQPVSSILKQILSVL